MDPMKPEGIPFILSAPSGTGKTTVCKILREKLSDIRFSISHTARPARPDEADGKDYYFISMDEFKKKIGRGEFLEWANVHNNYYGTTFETINSFRQIGQDLLLDLDVQGVQSLRQLKFSGVFIFLLPPSIEELHQRLKKRGTEPDQMIMDRIDTGKKEMTQYLLYDYVVTNINLDETVANLVSIIRSERCRTHRYHPPTETP